MSKPTLLINTPFSLNVQRIVAHEPRCLVLPDRPCPDLDSAIVLKCMAVLNEHDPAANRFASTGLARAILEDTITADLAELWMKGDTDSDDDFLALRDGRQKTGSTKRMRVLSAAAVCLPQNAGDIEAKRYRFEATVLVE